MKWLVKTLSIIIALIAGWIVTSDLYALLPPWSKEGWHLIVSDAIVLFLAFLLSSWLVYYLFSDFARWFFEKTKRTTAVLRLKVTDNFKRVGNLSMREIQPAKTYRDTKVY